MNYVDFLIQDDCYLCFSSCKFYSGNWTPLRRTRMNSSGTFLKCVFPFVFFGWSVLYCFCLNSFFSPPSWSLDNNMQEDYNEIVGGWKAKLIRSSSGEQRWGLFAARKNWFCSPSFALSVLIAFNVFGTIFGVGCIVLVDAWCLDSILSILISQQTCLSLNNGMEKSCDELASRKNKIKKHL